MGANRELIHGSVILNDISPRGLFLFSSRNLRLGERVTLVIHHPRTFYAHGKVVLCKRLSLRENVVSTGNTFPFRAGILFEFRSIDERLSVKNYCDELAFKWLKIAQISN
ncbi:MAG: hypothetical protein NDJ89_08270 [Oligoflexia bacterium]|nr:hypothetical protein [Oligoflexia bacterium]